MKKRAMLVLILVIVFTLIVSFFYLGNFLKKSEWNKMENQSNKTEISNPASKYCLDNGGNISIRTNETGGQYGICTFSDGKECEEWKFFRGECGLSRNESASSEECLTDSECIPSTCCHPTSCINKNLAPDCSNTVCTMECRTNTLDCGYGSCKCVNKRCFVVLNQ